MSKRKRMVLTSVVTLLVILLGFIGYVGVRIIPTLNTITKLTDGFYMMDYLVHYDVDKMMEGITDEGAVYEYGASQLLFADADINLSGIGCTTFNTVNENKEHLFGRNFDYTDGFVMLLWTHPDNGYTSVSTVDLDLISQGGEPDNYFSSLYTLYAPFACVDGMNEKGLCIAVLELETDATYQSTDNPDLTTTTIIRAVLDRAANVEEAIKIFESYDMHDDLDVKCAYHYHVTDANGDSIVIEYVNGEINLIDPQDNVNYQVVANYYLTKGIKDTNGFGQERVATATNALMKANGILSKDQAMDVLQSVGVDKQNWFGYECSTLWSVVYNTNDLTYDVCYKLDYNTVYTFSLLNPEEYTVRTNK